MRLIVILCFYTVILADLVAFNRYRNSAGTHVMKRTQTKPPLTTSDTQIFLIMMELINNGSNPATIKQIKSILQKMNRFRPESKQNVNTKRQNYRRNMFKKNF